MCKLVSARTITGTLKYKLKLLLVSRIYNVEEHENMHFRIITKGKVRGKKVLVIL
jgi:hypothetical protein